MNEKITKGIVKKRITSKENENENPTTEIIL